MDGLLSDVRRKIAQTVAGFAVRFRLYLRKSTGDRNDGLSEGKKFMNVKEIIMKRSTLAKNFAIAAVTALALAVAPTAKADNKGCSNATLKGTFSHVGIGFTTAPPSMAGPFAGVGVETWDGNGGITGTASLSANGNIIPATVTGTYKGTYNVNPDCTGTYTVTLLGGATSAFFVISDSGNEIHAICTDPGTVLTHTFQRQFPVGDWRN
jgi:hypothetical protein